MKERPPQYGIHWFRRDLRIAGNAALKWNEKQCQGRTLGIFFFDSKFLGRPDFSHHRFGFFLQTLTSLQGELREAGGDLLVLDQGPEEGFEWLFSKLKSHLPSVITFNRDYEPFARDRDSRISRIIDEQGIGVHTERDHLIIEPHELKKQDEPGSFYQIYTPFSRKWFSLFSSDEFQQRIESQNEGLTYLKKKLNREKIPPFFKLDWNKVLKGISNQDKLQDFIKKNHPHLQIPLPPAGSLATFKTAKSFSSPIHHYLENRDIPSLSATSHLSIYFKNGSITPALVCALLKLSRTDIKISSSGAQFLKELIWREFYYHILYHCPQVENEAFLPQYRKIQWENNPAWFDAWKEGRTGFPIVDAGMRQLKNTGLMHNRVRMIVASFLTKDLLIDWKWGERYFMNQLLDGDLAPNNGGWQWAASTGCDPQPYFRIFNPTLQSQKFDPQGDYIRKYVPELENHSSREIHAFPQGYFTPIVDHAAQKVKAVSLYRK